MTFIKSDMNSNQQLSALIFFSQIKITNTIFLVDISAKCSHAKFQGHRSLTKDYLMILALTQYTLETVNQSKLYKGGTQNLINVKLKLKELKYCESLYRTKSNGTEFLYLQLT